MRLTPELITGAYQWINPATRDRELDLRGYNIHKIENLGATLDQFDCLELSDNEIRHLDGFPLLRRIKRLLLNNNRVHTIAERLHESLPTLEWLILTNNDLAELGDIDALAKFTKLEYLSLMNNPLATKTHYRLYVIHKLPRLRLLDFRKVRQRERDEARKLFKGKKGRALEEQLAIKSSKTFTPGQASSVPGRATTGGSGDKNGGSVNREAILAAIDRASTLEEVERLNQMLIMGNIPGSRHTGQDPIHMNGKNIGDGGGGEEMDEGD